jgi:hypothetical protein
LAVVTILALTAVRLGVHAQPGVPKHVSKLFFEVAVSIRQGVTRLPAAAAINP